MTNSSHKLKILAPWSFPTVHRRIHRGDHAIYGFTLIELLVVIAIISLLVSILLPSLQRAKLLARQLNCLVRLRGIGSVYHLYLNDFNNRGPVGFTYGSGSTWKDRRTGTFADGTNPYNKWYGWYGKKTQDKYGEYCWALGEYLERKGCQVTSDGGPEVSPVSCPSAPVECCSNGATYAVNNFLGFDTFLGDYVRIPADTPMLMDGVGLDVNTGGIIYHYKMLPFYWGGDYQLYFPSLTRELHEGSANYLFFDGHAEMHKSPDSSDDEINEYFKELWDWKGDG